MQCYEIQQKVILLPNQTGVPPFYAQQSQSLTQDIMKEGTAFLARHKTRRIGSSCSRDMNSQGGSLKRQY